MPDTDLGYYIMKKQMLTVLLALVAGTMCAKVKIGNLNYNLDAAKKTATVVSNLQNNSNYVGLEAVEIPATVQNNGTTYTVTSLGEGAFEECKTLTSVKLPDCIKKIGESAFEGCTELESINFPEGLQSIGSYSFKKTALTFVSIPSSVTILEDNAFEDCRYIDLVEIHSDVIISKDYKSDDGIVAIFGPQVKEYILGDEITRIGNHVFYNCSGLQKITIGANVEEMGNYAFENCKNIDVIICNAKNAPLLTKRTFKNMGNKAYVYIYVPEGRERSYKRDQFWGEFDIYTQGTEPKGDKED